MDERRSSPRARASGARVAYEGPGTERGEADAFDLSKGGLFLQTTRPIAVGKRLSLEIFLAGEPAAWPALGRVVWIRGAGSELGPPGMGVKLIDADDDVLAKIERVVASSEAAQRGAGERKAPSREPTLLGVGLEAKASKGAEPAAVLGVPSREKTVLGVGASAEPAEASEPEIELAAVKEVDEWLAVESPAELARPAPLESPVVEPVASAPSEESLAAADAPRRRGRWVGWIVVLILVAGALVLYPMRDRLPWLRAFLHATTGSP